MFRWRGHAAGQASWIGVGRGDHARFTSNSVISLARLRWRWLGLGSRARADTDVPLLSSFVVIRCCHALLATATGAPDTQPVHAARRRSPATQPGHAARVGSHGCVNFAGDERAGARARGARTCCAAHRGQGRGRTALSVAAARLGRGSAIPWRGGTGRSPRGDRGAGSSCAQRLVARPRQARKAGGPPAGSREGAPSHTRLAAALDGCACCWHGGPRQLRAARTRHRVFVACSLRVRGAAALISRGKQARPARLRPCERSFISRVQPETDLRPNMEACPAFAYVGARPRTSA